jgi:RecJ-like exonuclease
MARRESFSAHLECPKCGKKGNATWEENENPVHNSGGLDRSLESISTGFHKGTGKDSSSDPEILCDECKVPVKA